MRFALLSILLLAGCHDLTPFPPNPKPGCVGACEQGATIGCDWAQPSPGGVSCDTWCTYAHQESYMRPWADCVARAGDRGAVEACGISCHE